MEAKVRNLIYANCCNKTEYFNDQNTYETFDKKDCNFLIKLE